MSRPKTSLIRKINQLPDSSCHLSVFKPTNSLLHSRERATLLFSKYINLNPSDYELQTKETGVSADQ